MRQGGLHPEQAGGRAARLFWRQPAAVPSRAETPTQRPHARLGGKFEFAEKQSRRRGVFVYSFTQGCATGCAVVAAMAAATSAAPRRSGGPPPPARLQPRGLWSSSKPSVARGVAPRGAPWCQVRSTKHGPPGPRRPRPKQSTNWPATPATPQQQGPGCASWPSSDSALRAQAGAGLGWLLSPPASLTWSRRHRPWSRLCARSGTPAAWPSRSRRCLSHHWHS